MDALEELKARVEGHTDGPWETLSGEWGTTNKRLTMLWAGQRDDNDFMIATAFAESKADAELIAAAPKLLAALEAVEAGLAGLDVIFDGAGEDDEAIRTITAGLRAAIEEALR